MLSKLTSYMSKACETSGEVPNTVTDQEDLVECNQRSDHTKFRNVLRNMSSRALRKLHGDTDIVIPGLVKNSDSSQNEEDMVVQPAAVKKKKKKVKNTVANPFELLTAEDGENEDKLEDEEGQEESHVLNDDVETAKQSGAKPKKKKKKKKKGKGGQVEQSQEREELEEDIDATIREVNEKYGELPSNQGNLTFESDAGITAGMKELLAVEHRFLNPDNEMKRIFGSRVVQSEQSRRRNHRNRPNHRASWLATPKDNWPHLGKSGLSMAHLDSSRGCYYFTYEHNKNYQKIQFQFLDAVESLNPQNITNVLQLHPYHIDSLLQLSEVCRMSDDMQMAAELIERALYVFECSFHSVFSLTQGNCRLDYRRPENRAFYIALFRHLMTVGKKGCYRTALEFCKLLLSFDPDGDPLCVLLMIDFYAIKAEQYEFIIRMYHEWEAHRNLSQLPNFAFGVPLAMFYNARKEGVGEHIAEEMLQRSLIMFPGLLMPMLDQCSVTPDATVTAHSFFGTSAQLNQPEALKQLIALFVGRCHPIWKDGDVMNWLEKNVKEVIKRVDSGDPVVKEYAEKRNQRYQGTPRNIYRHIILSEIKDATAALPPEMSNTPVLSYDPLPPTDNIASYVRPQRPRVVDQSSNPLSTFFRSLLPNYNPQELVEDDVLGAAGGDGERQDFRQGVGALMEAMRELLNNIRPVEPPIGPEPNQDENGDDLDQDWD